MLKKWLFVLVATAILGVGGSALAHTPICSCWDNGDGTITCEGGFSDGSSAAGVAMRVLNKDGQVLLEGKMDKLGTFNFTRPNEDYQVRFDAGEGHQIVIEGKDILE